MVQCAKDHGFVDGGTTYMKKPDGGGIGDSGSECIEYAI